MKKIVLFLFLISFFAFSCTKEEITPDLIPEAIPMTVEVTVTTNVSIFNGDDGSITVKVSGGMPPYHYSIKIVDNEFVNQSSEIFTNLKAASYVIKVFDESTTANIKETQPIIITQPEKLIPSLLFTVTVEYNVLYYTQIEPAVIIIKVSSGTSPYTYIISELGAEGKFQEFSRDTKDFSNFSQSVPYGTYEVKVIDGFKQELINSNIIIQL